MTCRNQETVKMSEDRPKGQSFFQRNRKPVPVSAPQTNSAKALKEAYRKFKANILTPWEERRKQTLKRFKAFWNDALHLMARKRRCLHRKSMPSGSAEIHRKHKELNVRIKDIVSRNKAKPRRRLNENLSKCERVHCRKAMGTILQSAVKVSGKNDEATVNAAKFTERMALTVNMARAPQIEIFVVSEEEEAEVEKQFYSHHETRRQRRMRCLWRPKYRQR